LPLSYPARGNTHGRIIREMFSSFNRKGANKLTNNQTFDAGLLWQLVASAIMAGPRRDRIVGLVRPPAKRLWGLKSPPRVRIPVPPPRSQEAQDVSSGLPDFLHQPATYSGLSRFTSARAASGSSYQIAFTLVHGSYSSGTA